MKFLSTSLSLMLLAMPGMLSAKTASETPDPRMASATFNPVDVFELEYAADPQISPDGNVIVYVRRSMDIQTDKSLGNLWIMDADGKNHRPLTTNGKASTPRWSPDGKKLLYVSSESGKAQLFLRWMDSGQIGRLSNLPRSPSGIRWSPDGSQIAFSMAVKSAPETMAKMPPKPEGAKWAKPALVVDSLYYRADGGGYWDHTFNQLFVLPAEGGTPRQLTYGKFNHGGDFTWSQDNKALIISANLHADWEYQPLNSELYRVGLDADKPKALTDRNGPDGSPRISPDGKRIAWIGFDDKRMGYQPSNLYVMNIDGSDKQLLTKNLDRSVSAPVWNKRGNGLYVQYDDAGHTKIALVSLKGKVDELASELGGTSLGRPYGGGSFSVSGNDRIAFTKTSYTHPADVALLDGKKVTRLTHLNDDLFGYKTLGDVEEFWFESSADKRKVQAWLIKPPGYNPDKKYPLILEIHGGPFANYGARFSAEMQLFASAGYLVLYVNPRGSTSYGSEFGNLIHHNYPSQDYDDLMSAVDSVADRGIVDNDKLFVTGGSGGGVLTAWIVGNTDRFNAAVVAKPVINWTSFVLTSDFYPFFTDYWFPAKPWEAPEHYWKRSPLSKVGNVTTPTMLLTGEADYRTPMSETEQYYQALQLEKVETAMVRIPDAPHGIARRPSNLISKVAHILAWFERYSDKPDAEDEKAKE